MENQKFMVKIEVKEVEDKNIVNVSVSTFDFSEAKNFIGGYVEVVSTSNKEVKMLIDEDGLRKQLLFNPIATLINISSGGISEIVGNAVVTKSGKDDLVGFTMDEAYDMKFALIEAFEERKRQFMIEAIIDDLFKPVEKHINARAAKNKRDI